MTRQNCVRMFVSLSLFPYGLCNPSNSCADVLKYDEKV